jgi:hypothetical protein
LFLLFATSAADTGGAHPNGNPSPVPPTPVANPPPASPTPAANPPPASTTPTATAAKFEANVTNTDGKHAPGTADTGSESATSTANTCGTPRAANIPANPQKIQNGPNGTPKGLGEGDLLKNPKQKIPQLSQQRK